MDTVLLDSVAHPFGGSPTIYQFCREQGITLPCFCYHAKLSIAGNCRMCLVEANDALVVSCAIPLAKSMRINTSSARLRHSREGILEFLLVNHPLDCPICDQGGECDLQDITFTFGSDRGRFFGFKRAVDNLNCLGPLIKTVMSRCIHCTRCVRFLQEYAAFSSLGLLGRGSAMEIGTYINRFPIEELSANIIDLCPVGALTAMPYAFSYRPWELISFENIDIFDAMASSLRLDIVNNKVVRVLPVLDEHCNEEWITNKARFSLDALSSQRLLYPKILSQKAYCVISWPRAIYLYLQHLFFIPSHTIQVLCSHFLDLSTSLIMKNFFHSFGCSNIFYENLSYHKTDFRRFYLFHSTLRALENSSLFLFIALNLRLEAPLLNARLRKNYLSNLANTNYYSIGLALDYLTFPVHNLGSSLQALFLFLEGKLNLCSNLLSFSFFNFSFLNILGNSLLQPFMLLGSSLFYRKEADALASCCFTLRIYPFFHHFGIYFISDYLGKISFFEGVFSYRLPKSLSSQRNFLLLLEGQFYQPFSYFGSSSFIVFQGSYKSSLSYPANLLLPAKAYGEQSLSYFNLNGYYKTSAAALTAFRLAFSNLEIFSILNITRKRFFSSNFSYLRNFYHLLCFFSKILIYRGYFINEPFEPSILFQRYFGFLFPELTISISSEVEEKVSLSPLIFKKKLINTLFSKLIYNYYNTNIYSKNSKVMSLCATKIAFSTFSLSKFSL